VHESTFDEAPHWIAQEVRGSRVDHGLSQEPQATPVAWFVSPSKGPEVSAQRRDTSDTRQRLKSLQVLTDALATN
jgi:hypothetical protein